MEGGVASGFKPVEIAKVEPRLFIIVKGRRAVGVTQVYHNSPVSLFLMIKYFERTLAYSNLMCVTRSII